MIYSQELKILFAAQPYPNFLNILVKLLWILNFTSGITVTFWEKIIKIVSITFRHSLELSKFLTENKKL